MKELVNQRASYVFGALVLITGLSFWLTVGHGGTGLYEAQSTLWAMVILLACVKVRWILLDFMELRTAPRNLRLLFEVWVVALGAVLILINWFAG